MAGEVGSDQVNLRSRVFPPERGRVGMRCAPVAIGRLERPAARRAKLRDWKRRLGRHSAVSGLHSGAWVGGLDSLDPPASRTAHEQPDDEEPERLLSDEDLQAVRQIFSTLSDTALDVRGAWHAIVLAHAAVTVWGGLPEVHLVEEWRQGAKHVLDSGCLSEPAPKRTIDRWLQPR